MLFCTKCSTLNDDGADKCSRCKGHKNMREANNEDYVLLHNADQYTASVLAKDFDDAGVKYEVKPFDTGMVSYFYDSEVLPTDKSIFVRYGDIDKAKECSAALKEKMVKEQEEFPEDNMSPRKRIVIQIVSIILFFGAITAVVLASDYIANFLKGLFS